MTQMAQNPGLTAGKVGLVEIKRGCLEPVDFEGLFRMCSVVAASGIRPSGCDTPEQVLVAAATGMEAGLSFMQALQNVMVVNKRPTIWGDAVLALVNTSGLMEDFEEALSGEGDAMIATCTAKRKQRTNPVTQTFSVLDAKKAGLWNKAGPWSTAPKRMLQMRARAFTLRDLFPDVLKGLSVREEVEDYTASGAQIVASVDPVTGLPIVSKETPVDHSRTSQARELFKPEDARGAEPAPEPAAQQPEPAKEPEPVKEPEAVAEPAPAVKPTSDIALERLGELKIMTNKSIKGLTSDMQTIVVKSALRALGLKAATVEQDDTFGTIKTVLARWCEIYGFVVKINPKLSVQQACDWIAAGLQDAKVEAGQLTDDSSWAFIRKLLGTIDVKEWNKITTEHLPN